MEDLRNRGQSKLLYDVKYHPMDESIRPSQAAKRRQAHKEELVCDPDDSGEDLVSLNTSAEEDSDEEIEDEACLPWKIVKGKDNKRLLVQTFSIRGEVFKPKTSYNMNVHPQDKFLVISSDEEDDDEEEERALVKKRKLTHTPLERNPNVKDEVDAAETVDEEEDHHVDSDETNTNDQPVLASSEMNDDQDNDTAGATSSESSSHPPPDNGIRRREGMEVWHLTPGKRYFRHDHDSWPILPGQPFEIFHEKLEDQLAREALSAPPLSYDHDDKENDTNDAEQDSESENLDGISVIPASRYIPSSDDRELSYHRAQINHTLYDDAPPQPYGLDGAHGVSRDQEESEIFSEAMLVLASGGNLPHGHKRTVSQDSVLGPDDSDSVVGSCPLKS
ncbi:hypothetical protein GMOD_00007517 [Pyrenophora seminiperda CCB06]|uniref:Uncharacterized protein n=1 Tax=Pyrenophora seminiperda CCB06 TaxID=1302712 RepID=A0A3M7MDM0_9PLEO|nr:hypothetical protein GMOD_00007517 [Pyrenophora seminiperda CCB06]